MNPPIAPDTAPARRVRRAPPGWGRNVRADVAGGLVAALISIPLSIGFGILAFAPFGGEMVAAGVVSGLIGAAFLGLVGIVFGARTIAIYAPRSLVAFMIASVALHTIQGSGAAVLQGATPVELAAVLGFTLAMSGLIQVAFGLAGFGSLMKFFPTPVLAGFQNAAAILILWTQVPVLLGVPQPVALADLPQAIADARPLSVLVGLVTALVTALVMWCPPTALRRVPPALAGLVAGTLLHYLLDLAGWGARLGAVVGRLPSTLPDGSSLARIIDMAARPGFADLMPVLLAAAFSLAVVASLDFLVCTKIVETLSGVRVSANRELQRIGMANLVTPLLGGLAGAVSLTATVANHHSRARSSLSGLAHSLAILVLVVLLPDLLQGLPLAVVAGLIVVVCVQLFDRWSLQIAAKLVRGRAGDWRRLGVDLAVVVLVTGFAVIGDIVFAVALGITVAAVFFVLRMSRSVVRREYRGDAVRSRRIRNGTDAELLATHGARIAVFELDGPLFFGSTEVLADRVDAALRDAVTHVVLDFRRVNEVDSTGARLLLQLHDRLRGTGRHLALASADAQRRALAALRDAGVLAALTRDRIFSDVDHALEWAEDEVLAQAGGADRGAGDYPLERMDLLRGFSPAELATFRAALSRREFATGEELVREGDEGDELFLLVRGSASVRMRVRVPGHGVERLVSFSAGTAFGELALLDRETRSATVIADEPVVCQVLSRAAFEAWVSAGDGVALRLVGNLSRELSSRLRRANRMIAHLEG